MLNMPYRKKQTQNAMLIKFTLKMEQRSKKKHSLRNLIAEHK